MNKILIVGVGNPYRHDDVAGWAAIDLLQQKQIEGITLQKIRAETLELIDFFSSYPTIYLIDAFQKEDETDSFERIDALQTSLLQHSNTSSHGFGIAHTIELARQMDMLPQKLIIYAIAAHHFSIGQQISDAIMQNVEKAVSQLIQEEDIKICMNKV
jgi:hydrogenase maturation protease